MKPRKINSIFSDYFVLFWMTKVRHAFLRADAVCLVFDKQDRLTSVKDGTRTKRDEKLTDHCPDIDVKGETSIPNGNTWAQFHANRKNKQNLVYYLVMRLQNSHDRLSNVQKLIISSDNSAQEITLELGVFLWVF